MRPRIGGAPKGIAGRCCGMELYLGEEGGSGEEAKLSLGTAGERTQHQSRPAAPPPQVSRGVDINTDAQPGPRGREGGEGMFSHLHSPTPHRGGGGSREEEVTVEQAIAASATTLQQCGLPGSSAQLGGIAAAHGDGWLWLGGKRSSPRRPGRRRGGIAAAQTPARRCPGDGQCHEAVPTGRHRSGASLLGCPDRPLFKAGCPASSLAPLSSSLWSTGSRLWLRPNPLSRLIRL